MSEPTVAPFGTWSSPIDAAMVAGEAVFLSETVVRGDGVFWLEGRPAEAGRCVLMRADPWSPPQDVTPPGSSVRNRVHEYGGGSYAVHGTSTVFFVNDEDQRVYRQELDGDPVAVTPEPPAHRSHRYADLRVSPEGRFVACVRERHEADGIVNEIVIFPSDGSAEPRVAAGGRDFAACPRFAPDGMRLAWIEWDMPNMPWDGTELKVAPFGEEGQLGEARVVAGGADESVVEPSWSPDGVLHFVSDRSEWWNLYREEPDGSHANLTPMAAEFAVPMWEFGYSTYAFLGDGRIACLYRLEGVHHLSMLDPQTSELIDLDLPHACFEPPYLSADGTRLAFVAGGPTTPPQVVSLDFVTRAVDVLRESEHLRVDEGYVSVPEPIAFPAEGGTAYAFYYPPRNPGFVAPEGERPPLLVHCHGGPTSEVTPEFDLSKQYFTSRGFALVDVNYGGSTGYGRPFRDRLKGRWGVVDVLDSIAAARYLVEQGMADPDRLIITGGSAGGWTTLCALTFHDTFATGASYYGVSDLEPFATSTHKFELKYTDTLVGPWPEAAELWRSRSPMRHADLMDRPVLILQGLEDEVVPPSQAEIVVEALEAKGTPYAYLAFEGEQHGFRKAETIARCLEAELAFYGLVLGFEPAGDLAPLDVRNLG